MKPPRLSPTKRLELIRDVYQVVLDNTESFSEQRIGESLAYLCGAIAQNSWCQWNLKEPLVKLLQRHFKPDHPVWNYIEKVKDR